MSILHSLFLGAISSVVFSGFIYAFQWFRVDLLIALTLVSIFIIRDIYRLAHSQKQKPKNLNDADNSLEEIKRDISSLQQQFKRLKYFSKK